MNGDKFGGIAGLVLAGGRSRRMGNDKACLRPNGGASLLEIVHGRLASLFSSCFVSCAHESSYTDYNCIGDEVESCGPLTGIISAMRALRSYRAIFVLACDMPLLPAEMFAELIRAWRQDGERAAVVAWQSRLSGKIQMLCALYPLSSLPYFEEAYRVGEMALWNIVPAQLRLCLPYGPEKEKFFLNCNTPADLSCVNWDTLCV